MSLPLNQSYMPKDICWNGKSIQNATVMHGIIVAFMRRHTQLRLFSGFRTTDVVAESDHKCGLADDIVPVTQDAAGKAALERAQQDADALGVAFTEVEWTDTNKHLHISWARCPRG